MKNVHLILLPAIFVLAFTGANAQIIHLDTLTNWRRAFKTGLNINQAAFSGNWKGGGVTSFGFNTFMNVKANFKKGKVSWDNEVDMLYGMVNNEGQGYRKTQDRIFIDTKYGRQISKKWNLFVAVNMLSQFAKGYKYIKDVNGVEQGQLISDSFAPTFITSTLGAEYQPVSYFKMRFSPVAPRLTLLANNDGRYSAVDPAEPYGVPVGESSRFEAYAFQMMADFDKDLATNLHLKCRYVLFANYRTFEMNKVDHRVDLNLTASVNKFINVSIGGIFLYDFDQDASPQYSQAFSLGVAYSIQNYSDKE
ncbi:MAG: DUF3078 domain-containing protein [Cytophagales bacterium]|nr:DUF3078 domain-containing protein [Cytophagales bacterium]